MHRKLSPSIGTARSPTGANPRCPHPHLGDREGQRRRCESGRIRARSRIVKTVQVGTTPLNLALAPGGGRVYTSDFSSNTVSVVDTASYAVVAIVSVGRSLTDIAVNPDGKHAYAVASEINMNPHGNVSVIDTATNTVTATIEVGGNPKAIAVTPDGKHAYVTNSGDNTMSVRHRGGGGRPAAHRQPHRGRPVGELHRPAITAGRNPSTAGPRNCGPAVGR